MSWQNDVAYYAGIFGIPVPVALANVEAESNGRYDALGDYIDGVPRSLGAGQVQYKYHYDDYQYVQQYFGFPSLPSQSDVPGLVQYVKENPSFSYALAAKVGADFWQGAGGNFIKFLRGYVGPAVSDAEINRRKELLEKYDGAQYASGADPAVQVPGKYTIPIPAGSSDQVIGWILIAAGALIMVKFLGGVFLGEGGRS